MNQLRPYVGVTGITTAAEAADCLFAWHSAWGRREPTHDLMLGLLGSAKTLYGSGNSKPLRYPPVKTWPGIIRGGYPNAPTTIADLPTMLVHYAPGDCAEPLADQLDRALVAAGDGVDGVQINAPWPAPLELDRFRFRNHPALRVVLQVGPAALEAVDFDAVAVAERVDSYGTITDVLVDVSAGLGIEPDPAIKERVIRVALTLEQRGARVGVAGGLCAEVLHREPQEASFPWHAFLRRGFSIDAEGRLRDGAPGGGHLDLEKVRAYFDAAVAVLTGAPP